MPITWLDLLDDEHIIWRDHPSKWMLLPAVLFGVVLSAGYVALFAIGYIPGGPVQQAITTVVVLTLCFAPVALTELKRRNIEYIITNKRVAKKSRIFARTGDPINSSKIQNVQYDQGVIDRLLSVGEIQIMTSGRGDVDMRWARVRYPKSVIDEVSQQKDANL